ncbi:MAG TPA: GNAT family protein [Solirubrobacteraceae bacterium]|nr:GNAT family protein [Solirubrobacteraceae bacterium]
MREIRLEPLDGRHVDPVRAVVADPDVLQYTRIPELGAVRSYLIIDVDNRASERVAERCGYVREVVMRSIHLKQGRRIDAGLWSRLPSDP